MFVVGWAWVGFPLVVWGLGCWLKFDKTKGFEGEGPDAGKHQRKDLEVLTINANCAKTFWKAMENMNPEHAGEHAIVMAQELHVPSGGDEECKAKRFKSDCASKRWRCALGPAIKLAGGNRGGVAVMHRPWLDSVREDIIIPGQAVACWIHRRLALSFSFRITGIRKEATNKRKEKN